VRGGSAAGPVWRLQRSAAVSAACAVVGTRLGGLVFAPLTGEVFGLGRASQGVGEGCAHSRMIHRHRVFASNREVGSTI
jgi:hypothetical protein